MFIGVGREKDTNKKIYTDIESKKEFRIKTKKLPSSSEKNGLYRSSATADDVMHNVLQATFSFKQNGVLTTRNLQQCMALIVHDPVTKMTAMAHIDTSTTDRSIQKFLKEMRDKVPNGALQVHVTGGEETVNCPISKQNETKVMDALVGQKDLEIMSWDTRGKAHYTDIAFDISEGKLYGVQGSHFHKRYDENGHILEGVRRTEFTRAAQSEIMTEVMAHGVPKSRIFIEQVKERWRCMKAGDKKDYSPMRPLYHALIATLPERDMVQV